MRIIKEGQKPIKEWQVTCKKCGCIFVFDNRGFGACIDKYDIHTLEHISFNPLLDFGFHKSYEKAAIEGIEYALNKLS